MTTPLLSDTALLVLIALLALVTGSFLNVVIARLPVMLDRQWQAQARATLELPHERSEPFNLARPGSHCPGCQSPIAWHDNLPILGYIKRRGRCAVCRRRISLQYPLVEAGALALALWTVSAQGVSLSSAALWGACMLLLTLAVIDFRTQLLPDALTLPLLWAGLLYQLIWQPSRLEDALLGAVIGYLLLWGFYQLFRLLTGREGMGYGDFKLLAALGAWSGWQTLPLTLTLSAGAGAAVGIICQLTIPRLRGAPMPFGPFLAAAGVLMLLEGERLMLVYQEFLGFDYVF